MVFELTCLVCMCLDARLFIEEAIRTKPIKHENIVELLAVGFMEAPYFIVLEYMQNGDLKTYLRLCHTKSPNVPHKIAFKHLIRICRDVTEGFKYLAEHNFVHRFGILACFFPRPPNSRLTSIIEILLRGISFWMQSLWPKLVTLVFQETSTTRK